MDPSAATVGAIAEVGDGDAVDGSVERAGVDIAAHDVVDVTAVRQWLIVRHLDRQRQRFGNGFGYRRRGVAGRVGGFLDGRRATASSRASSTMPTSR